MPASSHSTAIWQQFPDLVPGVLSMEAVDGNTSVDDALFYRSVVSGAGCPACPPERMSISGADLNR
jgi:hypothetical protein